MSITENDMSDLLISKGHSLLDNAYEQLCCESLAIPKIMSNLILGLHRVRCVLPAEKWRAFCKEIAPKHELADLIRQDPFVRHSACRPRGYAGDAELLDYIYGFRKTPSTPLGTKICEYTTNAPAGPRGVRSRAKIISGIIDRLVQQHGSIRVLSIACGHLREAEMSQAVQQGMVSEYVAFDQDLQSLAHVDTHFINKNVRTVHGSVAELLIGKHKDLTGFDFVYAAGLYDYLSQKVATKMTTWMFNATAAGGTTLLTNFLRGISMDGFLEAFMDWTLIYRSPEELADTTSRIPPDQIITKATYAEDNNNVVFVELRKAISLRMASKPASSPEFDETQTTLVKQPA